jgi:hypothetical protein
MSLNKSLLGPLQFWSHQLEAWSLLCRADWVVAGPGQAAGSRSYRQGLGLGLQSCRRGGGGRQEPVCPTSVSAAQCGSSVAQLGRSKQRVGGGEERVNQGPVQVEEMGRTQKQSRSLTAPPLSALHGPQPTAGPVICSGRHKDRKVAEGPTLVFRLGC